MQFYKFQTFRGVQWDNLGHTGTCCGKFALISGLKYFPYVLHVMVQKGDAVYPLPSLQCYFLPYQIFRGNTDRNTKKTNIFPKPVTARCIRINPRTWKSYVSMRFDVLGCPLETKGKFTSHAAHCMYAQSKHDLQIDN